MNRKEIFEKVKAHLLVQGAKSSIGNQTCAYRGEGGLKCAIGALITDECYRPSLEGRSVDAYEVIEALECSGLEIKLGDQSFLKDLQVIHDQRRVGEWPEALAQFAKERNL